MRSSYTRPPQSQEMASTKSWPKPARAGGVRKRHHVALSGIDLPVTPVAVCARGLRAAVDVEDQWVLLGRVEIVGFDHERPGPGIRGRFVTHITSAGRMSTSAARASLKLAQPLGLRRRPPESKRPRTARPPSICTYTTASPAAAGPSRRWRRRRRSARPCCRPDRAGRSAFRPPRRRRK